MKKIQDIQCSDASLKAQFVQNWLSGRYNEALAILNQPQLESKAFLATCANMLSVVILELQDRYYSKIPATASLVLSNFNTAVNNFLSVGNWSSTVQYEKGNCVHYTGGYYLCINRNKNKNPQTSTSYWLSLGEYAGEQGQSAISNIRLNGKWNSTVPYQANDAVVYGDNFYFALRNNTGKNPVTSTADWMKFSTVPKAKIYISSTPPVSDILYDGLVWCQILS